MNNQFSLCCCYAKQKICITGFWNEWRKIKTAINFCSVYLQQSMDYLCGLIFEGSDKKIKVLSKLVFPQKELSKYQPRSTSQDVKEKKILLLFSIGSLYQLLLNNSFVFSMKEIALEIIRVVTVFLPFCLPNDKYRVFQMVTR